MSIESSSGSVRGMVGIAFNPLCIERHNEQIQQCTVRRVLELLLITIIRIGWPKLRLDVVVKLDVNLLKKLSI